MKADETIIIVDEHDNPIGTKLRANVTERDIYRVTALWLTNSRSDILLAQRGFCKKNNPGEWGPAVAGTVEAGETYEANITKEVYEELGLKKVKLTPFKKFSLTISGDSSANTTRLVSISQPTNLKLKPKISSKWLGFRPPN